MIIQPCGKTVTLHVWNMFYIFYICRTFKPHVGKYSRHGAYGKRNIVSQMGGPSNLQSTWFIGVLHRRCFFWVGQNDTVGLPKWLKELCKARKKRPTKNIKALWEFLQHEPKFESWEWWDQHGSTGVLDTSGIARLTFLGLIHEARSDVAGASPKFSSATRSRL